MKFNTITGQREPASTVEARNFAALDFLERSRDVANEVVVDGTRAGTSPSSDEENARAAAARE
jgi:hypothetical protein